jgi:hypothetical protein
MPWLKGIKPGERLCKSQNDEQDVKIAGIACLRAVLEACKLKHDAPKLTDFGDNIMLQNIDFDHVYDFGLIQSKIIVIYGL